MHWQEWEGEYQRGLRPLAQILPSQWPPQEVIEDFDGALQGWLEANAPLLTLRSCATKPAPLRRGRDLKIPGNGSEVIEIGDYDEPEFVPHEDYDDE